METLLAVKGILMT